MGVEQSREYYEELYNDPNYYGSDYRKSVYYPMFKIVVGEIKRRQLNRIVEVGCGAGSLAQMIMANVGVEYHGFDFSEMAVARAGRRTGKPELFYTGDARAPESYPINYDGIVCTEVLEHIEADLGVISNWRQGSTCICTVPNFLDEAHVRAFRHEDEVRGRYEGLIEIDQIHRVARPILAGRTINEYLRSLRWSRNNPKRFLAHLGIQTFENLAGWFVFSGRRRKTG